MFARHYTEVPAGEVGDGAVNTAMRWLIAEKDGAPNFYMRMVEIGANGNTPWHEHPWEHEVFLVEGSGRLVGESESYDLKPGDTALVPGGEMHRFDNTGETVMKMLCLIPAQKND